VKEDIVSTVLGEMKKRGGKKGGPNGGKTAHECTHAGSTERTGGEDEEQKMGKCPGTRRSRHLKKMFHQRRVPFDDIAGMAGD
jgi:hypothetical protein